MDISRRALLPFTSQQMFDLVTDVNAYPRFLPWCERVELLHADAHSMRATLHVRFQGVRLSFTTVNQHQSPHAIDLRLERGPFRLWHAHWRFRDLGTDASAAANAPATSSVRGVEVLYDMHYEFSSKTLAVLLGPAFQLIATRMLDAFVQRARQVYAAPAPSAMTATSSATNATPAAS